MFEYRFNILCVKTGGFWSTARKPWLVVHYSAAILYMVPPFWDPSDQSNILKKTMKQVPCIPGFIAEYPYFILSLNIIYCTTVVGFFVSDICFEILFFFFYIYWKILKQLKARSMSKRTFNLQRVLLIALFIQVMVPLNLFIFPIAYVSYATVFGYYNQGFNNLAIAIGSTHGICSTVTMILIHSPYRNVLLRNRANRRSDLVSTKISIVVQMT